MELAIQHSNNAATNWLIRNIGGPNAVERTLKRRYPGIFQDTSIVEYIPRGGRTYRNKASPHDYSRFLYAVWKGDIVGAREIKRLMALRITSYNVCYTKLLRLCAVVKLGEAKRGAGENFRPPPLV